MTPARRYFNWPSAEPAVFSAIAATLVFAFQWRYGFNWGDEGWLWYVSQRTALGQVPIRDVLSYDPGRFYWSAAVFKLLGRNGFFEQLVAAYLFGVIGLAVAYVAMIRAGLTRAWRIAVLILLAIVLGFPRHKVFEQTLSLVSAAGITFVLHSPSLPKRWFAYGLATGIAAFFGKNFGVYFVVAALLAIVFLRFSGTNTSGRTVAAFVVGTTAGYSPIFLMMVCYRGFLGAFIKSVLLATHWEWGLPIPFFWAHHVHGLCAVDAIQTRGISWLCVLVPLSYALLVWRGLRSHFRGTQPLATGASLAGIPCLHHAFHHADFPHIAQGVVPFVVAVPVFSYCLWNTGKRGWSLVCFSIVSLLILACWLPAEPLVQHLQAQAIAPQGLSRVEIDGRDFEVRTEQAQVMRAVQVAFRNCGSMDGSFLELPFYPGLYAFLGTRSPSWEVYYFWRHSEAEQQQEIDALVQNHTSLVLINKEASFDRLDWVKIVNTNPQLVRYISSAYELTRTKLPAGFELYALPGSCPQSILDR